MGACGCPLVDCVTPKRPLLIVVICLLLVDSSGSCLHACGGQVALCCAPECPPPATKGFDQKQATVGP